MQQRKAFITVRFLSLEWQAMLVEKRSRSDDAASHWMSVIRSRHSIRKNASCSGLFPLVLFVPVAVMDLSTTLTAVNDVSVMKPVDLELSRVMQCVVNVEF